MPNCNITIKSELITLSNSMAYLNIVRDFITSFNCKHTIATILSCNSYTTNKVKRDLLKENISYVEPNKSSINIDDIDDNSDDDDEEDEDEDDEE